MVSFGLGELFSASSVVKALGDAKFIVQAAAHGVSQGVLSVMQGGDFLSGAAGGFFGSLGASGFGAVAGEWGSSFGGNVFFGALSGGIGAELTGGNFWVGAVTGGIVAGFNHVMHKIKIIENNPPKNKIRTKSQRKIYKFSKNQVAYGLSEGLGVFASYDIKGNIIMEENNISVSASGNTLASSQNDVIFSGEVTVTGESYSKTLPLSVKSPYIINSGRKFIGTAEFKIPYNVKNFNVSIKAGYVFKNGDNLISVPIPSRITYTKRFKR